MWTGVLVAAIGCYLVKLAGLSVPERILAAPVVRRVGDALPIALLSALVGLQAFTSGGDLALDARAAGVAVAVVAVRMRAPFLAVVVAAAVTAAALRAFA